MSNFFERNTLISPKIGSFPTFNWLQQSSLDAKKTPLNSQDERSQPKIFPKIVASSEHLFTELTPRTYSNIHVHSRSTNNSHFSRHQPSKEDIKITNSIETVAKIYGASSLIQTKLIRKKDQQYKSLVTKPRGLPILSEKWREKTISSERILGLENRPSSHAFSTINLKTGGMPLDKGSQIRRPPTSRKKGASNFRKDRVKTETGLERENASPNFGNLDEEIRNITPKGFENFFTDDDHVRSFTKFHSKKEGKPKKLLRIHNEAFDTSNEENESPYELKPRKSIDTLEIDFLPENIDSDIEKNFHFQPFTERDKSKPKNDLLNSVSSIRPGRKFGPSKVEPEEKSKGRDSLRPPSRHKSPGHKKTDSEIQEELFPQNPNPDLDSSVSIMVSTQNENGMELMEFLEKGEWPKPKEVDPNIPRNSPVKKQPLIKSLSKTKSQPTKVGLFVGKSSFEHNDFKKHFQKNNFPQPVNRLKQDKSGVLESSSHRQILQLKALEDFDSDQFRIKGVATNKSSKALRQIWNISKPQTSKQKENVHTWIKDDQDCSHFYQNKTDLVVKTEVPFNTSLDKEFVGLFAK